MFLDNWFGSPTDSFMRVKQSLTRFKALTHGFKFFSTAS